MKMNKNTKIITGSVVALAVIVVLGIVYAAFTQQLNINGSATGRSSKWKVYFSRLTGPTLNGTAKELVAPEIKNGSTTIGDYSVSVTSPGDYIEYEFDVTNDGDYDAKLTGLTKNSNTGLTYTGSGSNKTTDENNVKSQIEYTLTYADGTTVLENDTLKSKETKTMKLKLLYKTFSDASLLPTEDVSISGLGITLTYSQDSNAKVNSDGTTPYVAPQQAYSVGDTFTLGTDSYHVIADSGVSQDYVVALKDTPLTVAEVNTYGAGHINRYGFNNDGTANDTKGDGSVGGIAYYSSETCYSGPTSDNSGCTTPYDQSEVKYAVDAWAQAKFTNNELKQVDGYSARLITSDDLSTNLGYSWYSPCPTCSGSWTKTESVPTWVYNSNYWYWTMVQYNGSSSNVWSVDNDGSVHDYGVHNSIGALRPVINVRKSAIQ